MHQFPPWGTWTARIDGEQRVEFIVGLISDRQEVTITWPLPEDAVTVTCEGGVDAADGSLDILQRCTGVHDEIPGLLSRLSHNPTAMRERP